ncbi:S-methyl-5-thioribose-1-phosphate isomerase [Bacteroidota bacterium]
MIVNGKHYTTIWIDENDRSIIKTIDQRLLPFEFKIVDLKTSNDTFNAIKNMVIRGAPLIGVTAAYGIYLALLRFNGKENIDNYINGVADKLKSSRPTAINLNYAVERIIEKIKNEPVINKKVDFALQAANELKNEELENSINIGKNGLKFFEELRKKKRGEAVNILTHCNAGWLACIDYGTATAPIYLAHDKGIKVHVWIDETRPRNQGARLTAWELTQHGVPCTLIPDNTGGHLMQNRLVDLVIVGSDRTTTNGDVVNKIGTYLKALAAQDNNIPFYVALPSTSIDWNISNGIKEIPIEERDEKEVKYIEGLGEDGIDEFLITDNKVKVKNYGFDITPSRLVTGLITERGICEANNEGIKKLFPEYF